ncbi:MAG: ATP-grasp domain-containing protein [Desulfovibrionaceae bacterium]|jgi:predicted ATP-grasp superfamily ATP-dependent carboligase|nr:ATP-grasp domain-containing protein [Desulfovibrionaceae bacterium]
MKKRIFVYEHLSGGPSNAGDGAANAELLAMGQSMRDAMLADLLGLARFSISAAASHPGDHLPRAAAALRPQAGETAFEFVARQSALHDGVWLVAPETDGLLARLQRAVPPSRWLGCSAGAIALTASKQNTLARLAMNGIATPLAFAGAPGIRRWVVKPGDGAGAVDTRVHSKLALARADQRQRAPSAAATLEPWVEGEPLSLSLMCSPGGIELLSINRQHIAIDAGGRLRFEGVSVDAVDRNGARAPRLAALAAQVGRAIGGLNGFVGIDLVWHPERGPVVIEVNARVTNAYVGLSAALGRNLAADLLARCLPPASSPAGRLSRTGAAVLPSPAGGGLWRGPAAVPMVTPWPPSQPSPRGGRSKSSHGDAAPRRCAASPLPQAGDGEKPGSEKGAVVSPSPAGGGLGWGPEGAPLATAAGPHSSPSPEGEGVKPPDFFCHGIEAGASHGHG